MKLKNKTQYIFLVFVIILSSCTDLNESEMLNLRMTLTWGNIHSKGGLELSQGEITGMEGYGLEDRDNILIANCTWSTTSEIRKPG